MAIIENWSLVTDDNNPYKAPELRVVYLKGDIYGDERFKNGEHITTSVLTMLDIRNKKAQTYNTEYILGEPDSEYKNQYVEFFENMEE